MKKRRSKKERQELLQQTIESNPFITDEDLAEKISSEYTNSTTGSYGIVYS